MDFDPKDVIALAKAVKEISANSHYNPNGPDYTDCPFCTGEVGGEYGKMEEIKHDLDCPYLLAKDMLTNIK